MTFRHCEDRGARRRRGIARRLRSVPVASNLIYGLQTTNFARDTCTGTQVQVLLRGVYTEPVEVLAMTGPGAFSR